MSTVNIIAMIKDLRELLGSEDSETLFSIIKHDDSIDFDKKLVAGRILHERSYDTHKLREEKNRLIKSLEERVNAYNNYPLHVARNKKVVRTEFLFSLAYVSLFLLIGLWQNIFSSEQIEWFSVSILLALTLAFVAYKAATFKRRLKLLHDADKKDREVLRCRLYHLNNEWAF